MKKQGFPSGNKNVSDEQRILSLDNEPDKGLHSVLAWSVRAIIFWGQAIVKAKREKTFVITLRKEKHNVGSEGLLTLYREHFLRLKNIPKPTRDQLIILLPMQLGLRSGEVASLRIENIDLDNGDVQVRDSKKYRLYPIPLTYEVARLIQELLTADKRREGWLLVQDDRVAWRRGKPMTTIGLCWVWHKWARKAGIPNWQEYNPRLGRHFFAAEWDRKHGSTEKLRRILRHKHLETTQIYLSKLVFYEDVKLEMQRLQTLPIKKQSLEGCERREICKFYVPGENGCMHQPICRYFREVEAE